MAVDDTRCQTFCILSHRVFFDIQNERATITRIALKSLSISQYDTPVIPGRDHKAR